MPIAHNPKTTGKAKIPTKDTPWSYLRTHFRAEMGNPLVLHDWRLELLCPWRNKSIKISANALHKIRN